ncbi:hypothetical protein SmphiM6_92 [Sinorhizobium phage phiM6]|nr:hypothetical protein SmphiM6_92 [Sinorhizobium phage phiM6]
MTKSVFRVGDRVTLIDGNGYFGASRDVGKSGIVLEIHACLAVKFDDGRVREAFPKRWKLDPLKDYKADQEPMEDEECL